MGYEDLYKYTKKKKACNKLKRNGKPAYNLLL